MGAKVVKGWPLHRLAPGAALLRLARKLRAAHAIEHGGLKSGKTEVQRIPSHLDVAEIHRVGISEAGEFINHRTAGISQSKQPRDLVKSFARGVVARVAKLGVIEARRGWLGAWRTGRDVKQSGVAAGNHQRDGGQPRFRERACRRRGPFYFPAARRGCGLPGD